MPDVGLVNQRQFSAIFRAKRASQPGDSPIGLEAAPGATLARQLIPPSSNGTPWDAIAFGAFARNDAGRGVRRGKGRLRLPWLVNGKLEAMGIDCSDVTEVLGDADF